MGYIGDETTRIDGYSAVVTWPGQPVLKNTANEVTPWPGMDLEGGWFIQNGYYASTNPCEGLIWTFIFKPPAADGSSEVLFSNATETKKFCQGEPVQFKAEREGTIWIFSYRVVGSGGFVEHDRYDFGAVRRGVNPIMALTEMYDFDDTADKIAPISITQVMGKVGGQWKPVERMEFYIDFFSPHLMARPEPELVGVTTSAAGPKCYKVGDELFSSATSCYASKFRCDSKTGICNP